MPRVLLLVPAFAVVTAEQSVCCARWQEEQDK